MLDRLVAAGASADAIVAYLRAEADRQRARRKSPAALPADRPQPQPQAHAESPPLTPSQLAEREVYARGRRMFGARAGGLMTRLRQHFGYDDRAVLRALDLAASKYDPKEYLLGMMRGKSDDRSIIAAFDRLERQLAGEDDSPACAADLRRLPPR